MSRPGKTWLYLAHGADGRVLYVGIARDWPRRWQHHAARSAFFPLVSRLDVQQYDTRRAAEEAERAAIASYKPTYNVQQGARQKALPRHHVLADLLEPVSFCEVEFYCPDPACVVREVTVRVKWHLNDPKPKRAMLCPACYEPLKFHAILPRPDWVRL